MTWEELKEKAKEMGYKLSSIKYSEVSHLYLGSEYQEEALTYNGKIYFTSGGDILLSSGYGCGYIVLHHFNYIEQNDKMLMIMRGLE